MRTCLILCVLVFSSPAIKAQASFPSADSAASYLTGSWSWTRSIGGIAGLTLTPGSVGYTRTLIISAVSGSPDSIECKTYTNSTVQSVVRCKLTFTPTSVAGPSWTFKTHPIVSCAIYSASTTTMQILADVSDAYNEYFERSPTNTGLADLTKDKGIYVYPNPAHDHLHIQSTANLSILRSEFISAAGQSRSLVPDCNSAFDTTDLTPGVYVLRVTTDRSVYTTRFVKN